MKKIVIILLLPLLLGSCFKDNEDIFDSPAAERIAQALREYQEALVSSEYGWSMDTTRKDHRLTEDICTRSSSPVQK